MEKILTFSEQELTTKNMNPPIVRKQFFYKKGLFDEYNYYMDFFKFFKCDSYLTLKESANSEFQNLRCRELSDKVALISFHKMKIKSKQNKDYSNFWERDIHLYYENYNKKEDVINIFNGEWQVKK